MTTLAGLIPNDEHVDHVVESLESEGIFSDRYQILTRPADVWQRLNGHRRLQIVFRNALRGMLIGLGIGMLYGVPAGFFNCRLMNCELSTSLVMLLLISLYWVAGGAVLGAIIGLDRLERPLYSYVEGVRRGEALMVVETTEAEAPEVFEILTHETGSMVQPIPDRP